jgi:hypothetical protein
MLDSYQNNGQLRSSNSIACSSLHPPRTILWHRGRARSERKPKLCKLGRIVISIATILLTCGLWQRLVVGENRSSRVAYPEVKLATLARRD